MTTVSIAICDYYFSFIYSDITDDGIRRLLESLESNRTLVKLEIEGNPIFDRELKNRLRVFFNF